MGNVNELKKFTRGQLDSTLMKIGQDVGMNTGEAIKAFLRDELIIAKPERNWREGDEVIYLTVTPDGATGPDWIPRTEKKGNRLDQHAEDLLRSPDFEPTLSNNPIKIAIIKGEFFEDSMRVTKNIRTEASNRGWTNPNADIACLIREKFTDEEIEKMGLWWITTMHEPIKNFSYGPGLLGVGRGNNGRWLTAYPDYLNCRWGPDSGFAFAASQI